MRTLPRAAARYVLLVEAGAAAAVAPAIMLSWPVTPADLVLFALLAGGSAVHLEAARGIDRLHDVPARGPAFEDGPRAHLRSTWFFAGVLLLPAPLLVTLIAISYAHAWARVRHGRASLSGTVFSACTVVLGCAVSRLVLTLCYDTQRDHPIVEQVRGPFGLVAVSIAAVAYWAVSYALVVAAVAVANPGRCRRDALGDPSDQLTAGAAVCLGTAVALLLAVRPWLVPVLLVTVLALHLGLLVPQLRAASRTDSKTGLVDASFWRQLAERELDRARRLGGTLGILLVDLDHFKSVNDRFGHLAGDHVLRVAATALRQAVPEPLERLEPLGGVPAGRPAREPSARSVREPSARGLVGRFGGEEFVVLLPGAGPPEVTRVAERLRRAISQLTVYTDLALGGPTTIHGLTASVGAATYPARGCDLTTLLLAADAALLDAKHTGRNRVHLA